MKSFFNFIILFTLLNCSSLPTPNDNEFKPTNHIISTMGAEMRLVICIPTCNLNNQYHGNYNLSSDSNKLVSQGECYYDYLIPINEMTNLAQNLSDTTVFNWVDMTAVSPYPDQDCFLLVYGNSFNDFMCSIGPEKSAGELLKSLIEPLSGEARSDLNKEADSLIYNN